MLRLLPLLLLGACAASPTIPYPNIGSVEAMQAGILPADALPEDLGGAFGWSEGPVWIEDGYLLFTDVPGNTIWKFSDQDGLSVWMQPSGADPVADYTSSPGANGLLAYKNGTILAPDHGNRALYVLDLDTQKKTLLADQYEGQRFNSPNDVVVHSSGTMFFTDPPYGLKDQDGSSAKEIGFNGVYALQSDGSITLIDDRLTRPNGIVLSPDGATLYVSNSDPADAKYMTYPIESDGSVGEGRLFLDVTALLAEEGFGNPDGMAVAKDGTIFATGPGGVLVLSPDADILGTIRTGKPVANVAFGDANGRTLYMTSQDRLTRIQTLKTGLEF